jgi:hypothetical protein
MADSVMLARIGHRARLWTQSLLALLLAGQRVVALLHASCDK